jgi:hypothetical protein
MNRFIPADQDTDYLLPPSVDDWLPENHLARFTVEREIFKEWVEQIWTFTQ